MKINKKELLSALKADLKSAETYRDVEDKNIQRRKNEHDGKPYGNEQKGKSSIVSKDIKRQSEWQHASLIDPFVASAEIVKCTPITWEDKASAEQNQIVLNTQFCRQFDRFNFMTTAIKVLDREGTCVVQTGWEYEDKEITSMAGVVYTDPYTGEEYVEYEEQTETVVLKNRPTAKVHRNEDVYIDPTCMGNMSNCQFVIVRYETDMSTLKKDGRYKNLDKVKPDANDANSHDDYETEYSDISTFTFQDDPRKKIVVYEYWGNYDINNDGIAEPIVCAWVGDVVIRLQDNPYPEKDLPFIVVPFNSVPFSVYGESNADLISDNQKIKTAITRGIIDNMAQSTNGMVGIKKNALDAVNKKKFLAGKNFEYNGSTADFWQGSYNQIPNSAFNMLAMMDNNIESITGIKSFSGGITGNSIGNTATSARGALDATATRKLNIVRNIAENLVKPLLRKWMSYNAEFLEETEVVRITNDEFVEVRRDDLSGRIDIDITISTPEDNEARAQELSFLLQTMGPAQDFELNKIIMAEIAKLRRMPDMAKRIEEFQPQPDPMSEKMKQVQLERAILENEEIRANIADKYARAGENKIDAEVKRNKAAVEAAKARKLGSEADKLDLAFLKDDQGYAEDMAYAREMRDREEKQRDRQHQYDMAMVQMLAGDKQIGVVR